MQKIVISTNKSGNDFKVFTADLWLNWLVPYFRNHRYVTDLVFNRDFHNSEITIEFNVINRSHVAFLRFANDLSVRLSSERLHIVSFTDLRYKKD